MPVFLEIARAAGLSLARRLGPWLLGLAVVAAVGLASEPELAEVFIGATLFALVGAALPVAVGTGLRRWLRAGPLGLAERGAGYWATFGYGLGAAAVALPFVLAGVRVLDQRSMGPDLAAGALAVMVAAWLGASAGRLVDGGLAVAMLTWIGAAVVGACSFLVVAGVRELAVPALGASMGTRGGETLLWSAGAVLATHLVMLAAAWADQRAPTRRES